MKHLHVLIAESPAYQKTFFRLFTLRYSSLTTLIEDIKFKWLDSRILEYLRSFDTKEIIVKNSDIAEHLGTSINVINRVLQDLKDKKFNQTRTRQNQASKEDKTTTKSYFQRSCELGFKKGCDMRNLLEKLGY